MTGNWLGKMNKLRLENGGTRDLARTCSMKIEKKKTDSNNNHQHFLPVLQEDSVTGLIVAIQGIAWPLEDRAQNPKRIKILPKLHLLTQQNTRNTYGFV